MDQDTKTSKTTTFLFFFFFISLYASLDRTTYSSGCYALLATFLVAFLVVFAVRTTTVTWITVVVLLAFAGKRRRVLAKEGRKITCDVAMYLAQVVLKERSLVAFASAAILIAFLKLANQSAF